MKKALNPETLFTPIQLLALDAWIAKMNVNESDGGESTRAEYGYAEFGGVACFTALDGQLETHCWDEHLVRFVPLDEVDETHPLYNAVFDILPIPGAPVRF